SIATADDFGNSSILIEGFCARRTDSTCEGGGISVSDVPLWSVLDIVEETKSLPLTAGCGSLAFTVAVDGESDMSVAARSISGSACESIVASPTPSRRFTACWGAWSFEIEP